MSAINVNSITGRTGLHGPVLTGVSTAADGFQVLAGEFKVNGISTFVGMSTFNGGIDVAGTGEFKVSGVSTFVGISTFNAGINVTGGDVVVGGAATISSAGAITAAGTVRIGGDANNGVAEGFKFDPNGLMQVSRGDGVSAVWAAYTQGSSTQTSRINNNGNAFFLGSLGVGTNNPGQKLHVLGDGSTAVQVSDGTNNQYFASIATADNFSNGSVAGDALIRGQSGFSVSPNNGSSVKLRVDSSGRVLIGGTSSTGNAVLTVQGLAGNTTEQGTFALRRSSGNGNNNKIGVIEFSGGDNNQAALIQGVGDNTWGTDDYPGRLEFYTTADGASTPTERLRVDSSGRMLIGATSAVSGADANGLLQVSQDVGNNTCIIVAENTASSGNLSCFRARLRNSSPDSIFSAFLQCDDSSAGSKAVIRSNGGLANFSANNVNLSDRNVKKDITAAAGTWNSIKNWEIVNFRYKEQPDDADLNLGVIAQQIEEVSPEMVTIFQQAKEATETEPACEQRLGVKEQQMQWAVIKALQEAMARIETLETQNAALEARLTALEGS